MARPNRGQKRLLAAGVAVCGVFLFYWERPIQEPQNIHFQERHLDVQELQVPHLPLPVWFVKTKNPTVAMSIEFPDEGERNFSQQPGLFSLLSALIEEGVGPYSKTELKNVLDEHCLNVSCSGGDDSWGFSLYAVPEKWELGVDILLDYMLHAHLPEKELERIRKNKKDSVWQTMIYPGAVASEGMNQLLYPKDHPYSWSFERTLQGLETCTREDIVKAYKQLFDPRHARVVVAGNLEPEEVVRVLFKLFSALAQERKNDFKKVQQETGFYKEGVVQHISHEAPQTIVSFALPSVRDDSPDVFAARVACDVFGGGTQSRLFTELREKLGLVYGIGAGRSCGDMSALVRGNARIDPQNREVVVRKIREVLELLVEKGITAKELEAFKVAYALSENLHSAPKIVAQLAVYRVWGVPVSQVNTYPRNMMNLTIEKVNTFLKGVDPHRLTVLTVGPGKGGLDGGIPGEKDSKGGDVK